MALNHLAIPCRDAIRSIEKQGSYQLLVHLLSVLTVSRLLVVDDLLALNNNVGKTTPFSLINKPVRRLVMRISAVMEMMRLRTKNALLQKHPHTATDLAPSIPAIVALIRETIFKNRLIRERLCVQI